MLGLGLMLAACTTPDRPQAASVAEAYPPNGQFVEIDGTRLHYKITGPAEAPALLVLHGASSNLNEPLTAFEGALSQFRAIYLDRPGLGWSERPEADWNPGKEADLIAAFLDEIGETPALVMGHSWGAAIALRLAMDHPGRVDGLVLLAPAVRAWVGEAALYNKATHWPLIGTVMTRLVVPTIGRARLEAGVEEAFAPEPVPEGYIEKTRLPLILRASNWKANAHDMAHVNRFLADQEERYGQIDIPAVIIAGTQDNVVSTRRHAVPVAGTMPDAELILIEGAGHNLHHHHTARIAEAVEQLAERTR